MKKQNSHPKVIILGIDGLEYDLVNEWKLTNIMQKTYSKLNLSDYKVIVTPPIWGSMLTGKIDDEIMKIWVKRAEIIGGGINTKQKWWTKIGNILPPKVDIWVWDHMFLPLIGGNPFERTANYVIEKNQKNFFQFFKKPWTNGIPGYGKVVDNPTTRRLLQDAIIGKDIPFRDIVTNEYNKSKNYLLSTLEKRENDLIFWYTMILDKFGHVYMKKPLTLMDYYLEINNLVGKIINYYQESYIYIISDHGMELAWGGWGMHSNKGFFSSNTGEKIKKPYDLYNLVLKYKTI
jgi:hypothetical protein